jgi:hypothetical protein
MSREQFKGPLYYNEFTIIASISVWVGNQHFFSVL